MKKLLLATGLIALTVAPAASAARPSTADKREAARECAQLKRTVETRANFVALVKLEARANRRNAFGRCVAVRRAAATAERREARSQAVEECSALRPGPGTRGRPESPSAFGQCVAEKSRQKNRELDAQQREQSLNPARTCRAMQKDESERFKAAYGTAANAFGKCVSAQAKKQGGQDEQ